MGRIWLQAKGLAAVACVLFLVQCSGEIELPETRETPLASGSEPQVTAWVSCLPPQWDPPAMPEYLCPSPAPGQYMLTLTESELVPKIEAAIAVNNEGRVTNVVLTFKRGAFVIRGTLQRAPRPTIQVSGRLVVRNGRIEAEMVKGKVGFFSVPASYMAEGTAEVNEILDSFFRTEYGIRVTNVVILPGELRLTGEPLR